MFIFVILLLLSLPEETDPKQYSKTMLKSILPITFFRSSMASGIIFSFSICFEFIFVYGIRKWLFHSFACGCPSFSTPVEVAVFSLLYILASFFED